MKNSILVEMDEEANSPRQCALNLSEILQEQGDNTSEVFERTKSSAVVVVYESSDAEQEITERLNNAGVGCFVEFCDFPPEDAIEVKAEMN
jgi:hypothetical protein